MSSPETTNAESIENATDAALEAVTSQQETIVEKDTISAALAAKDAELAKKNSELLKSQAEFENFRKRIRRDAEEELRYAAMPLIRELLPVIDNLERAAQAAGNSEAVKPLVDGVLLVASQFNQALSQIGCQRIESLGKEFDPHMHQALAQEPHVEIAAGYVSRELQAGYKLHERVVRPAQVFVSTGAST
jgi:molecular chaperone GrpE